jgi:hypothetical protein
VGVIAICIALGFAILIYVCCQRQTAKKQLDQTSRRKSKRATAELQRELTIQLKILFSFIQVRRARQHTAPYVFVRLPLSISLRPGCRLCHFPPQCYRLQTISSLSNYSSSLSLNSPSSLIDSIVGNLGFFQDIGASFHQV